MSFVTQQQFVVYLLFELMNYVNLDSVSLGFGGELLLEEVNFRIKDSERIGLIGRNGMGKTTLLRLISGEINPDLGVLSVFIFAFLGFGIKSISHR